MIPTIQLGHILFQFAVLGFLFSGDHTSVIVVTVAFFFNLGMV